jgi:hypothetical protein
MSLLAFTVAAALAVGAVAQLPPWQNWTLPVGERVAALVSALTLDEKLSQLYDTSASVSRLGIPSYGVRRARPVYDGPLPPYCVCAGPTLQPRGNNCGVGW